MKNLSFKNIASSYGAFVAVLGLLAWTGGVEDTTNQPEITKEKSIVLAPMTFEVDVSSATNPNNPSQQLVVREGVTDPSCGTSTNTICSAELDLDLSNPAIQELLDKIENEEPVTIQDFLNVDPTLNPQYDHKP